MVVTPTRAKRTGLFLASGRQGNVEPAGGETDFIVEACRVSLKDQPQTRRARRERQDRSIVAICRAGFELCSMPARAASQLVPSRGGSPEDIGWQQPLDRTNQTRRTCERAFR